MRRPLSLLVWRAAVSRMPGLSVWRHLGAQVAADRELRKCVAEEVEPEMTVMILAGVRAGGSPGLPTLFRWE